ncbi:MAG: hypothetical protein HRU17_04765 [Polyangiaceae bacterium]|nr:hypothetical protein [Polyangiaceae bacterium]
MSSPRTLTLSGIFLLAGAGIGFAGPAPGDGEKAKTKLAQIAKSAPANLVKQPVAQARKALERVQSVGDAKDKQHQPMLEGLAWQWTKVAADLIRAAAAEDRARSAEEELATLRTKLVRAQALLEQTIARRDRAKAQLPQTDRAGTAASAAKQRVDAKALPAKPAPAKPASTKAGGQ